MRVNEIHAFRKMLQKYRAQFEIKIIARSKIERINADLWSVRQILMDRAAFEREHPDLKPARARIERVTRGDLLKPTP
jgi:hypothetical protein